MTPRYINVSIIKGYSPLLILIKRYNPPIIAIQNPNTSEPASMFIMLGMIRPLIYKQVCLELCRGL